MLSRILSDIAVMAAAHLSLVVLLAKATIILVAALAVTFAMQRTSAGARHLVWLVTLATLLVMPALTAWGPLPLRILPAVEAPRADARLAANPPVVRVAPVSEPSANVPAADASTPSTRSVVDDLSGVTIALALWAVVVLAIGCSLIWSALVVRRLVRRARPLDAPEWLTPLWEVSDRLGLDEAPRLLRSEDAKMPFACGVLTPTIVLPAECDGWSLERRRAVLLHELAHVRRHDLLGHTLGRVACAVYWFHPLVWTAAKQLRSESERACDDLALACGTRATDYAEHLLDIVTSVRRDATPSVALAMARRKEFEGRMLAILDPQLKRAAPSRGQTTSLLATLALLAIVVGAAAPVPRAASAATVAQRSAARDSIALVPQVMGNEAPTFEQDSRIHGIEQRTVTRQSTSVSTSMRTVTSDIASAGATAGANAAARALAGSAPIIEGAVATAAESAVRALFGTAQGARNQKSDDRPILLAKVLRTDTSATLRRVAAWGLSEYASTPIAAEALANAVRRDASAGVREMAAWSLAEADEGEAGVIDALSAALRGDADTKVRATAAWALGNVGDHAATDALVAALGDASPEVRMRALWAIGNVEPKQAPRQVLALLSDKDTRVRELAAWTLYSIEDPAAAPALEAALRTETNKDLQLAYIHALAALGEKSVDAIRGLLESPDQRIKTMAVKALAGGHAAGPWPWPWPEPRPYP
ncbi:MAG TPA: HEAT repeat domain-containing protein [Gemmatimonadaceae bacterium]|nr:HEAT repeat domain-containing protein [Gemmatimonadaceae bacterium]